MEKIKLDAHLWYILSGFPPFFLCNVWIGDVMIPVFDVCENTMQILGIGDERVPQIYIVGIQAITLFDDFQDFESWQTAPVKYFGKKLLGIFEIRSYIVIYIYIYTFILNMIKYLKTLSYVTLLKC